MTRNRYPVDTCTPQLASRVICIYVFAPCVRFSQPRFSGESSVLQNLFHPRETGLINRCVTSRRITRLRFLAYIRPNIRNKRPSLRRSIFSFKGNSWNLSNFHFGAASTFRLYALLMSLPLLLFFFLIPLLQRKSNFFFF